jgi:hypothetical protein
MITVKLLLLNFFSFNNFLKKDIKFVFLKKKSLKKTNLRSSPNKRKKILRINNRKRKKKRIKNSYQIISQKKLTESNQIKIFLIHVKKKTKNNSERKKESRHIYILLDKS